MGSKRVLYQYQLFDAGLMLGTSTITSPVTNVGQLDNIGIQVRWTGTPTGTISVMCSVNGTDFDALSFYVGLDQPVGSAGGYLISLNQLPFEFVRLQYVNASGSGLLNAWISGKDLN